MTRDEKVVEFPNSSEDTPQQRAFKKATRLANLAPGEWKLYVEDDARTLGIPVERLTEIVLDILTDRAKKAKEEKADVRREEARAERSRIRAEREDKRTRQDESLARKEADRIAREEEAKRKKREAVFAEISDLPKLTHETRLKEAASRLGETFESLVPEFEIYLAARTIPEGLEPWPDPVDTAELLAAIEAKFRRYVVASPAIVTASVLWALFTYVVEIATHAPKLLYTFPVRNAGKTTALHVVRWMAQRSYVAVEATGAVLYRIIDRLKPTLFLDEADSLFQRRNALAHIINESWTNSGSKIPRAKASGKGYDEYDVYGTQAISMRGLKVPDTTLSRCIICLIWPKLESEPVEEFYYKDDDDFKVFRRKARRWAIDHAVALRAATPEFPPGFNNRIRMNYKMLLAIADLASGEWPKRARNAALELETGRDEPSEEIRLFAALRDVWGKAQKRASKDLCAALVAHPSGEWADFRGKGPISPHQLAALLRPFGIRLEHNLHLAGSAKDNQGGYLRSQFENAWARLLQKPSRGSLTRSPPQAKVSE
jgi:hypothetical protein